MMKIGLTDMGKNGYMNYIMQSQQNVNTIIKDFENALSAGCDPNLVLQQVFEKRGIREYDLTATDKKKLERRVQEIYAAFQTRRY